MEDRRGLGLAHALALLGYVAVAFAMNVVFILMG